MSTESNLQEQNDGQSSAPPIIPSSGQSEDVVPAKRFTELQRTFNTLQNKTKGLEDLSVELQSKVRSYETQLTDISKESQSQLTSLQAELEAARNAKTLLEQEVQSIKAAQQKLQRETEVRKVLADGFQELTPLFDKGYLDVGTREGDDLKEFLSGFRDLMGVRETQAVEKKLKGSSPRVANPATATPDKLTFEDLERRLETMDFDDPQYPAIEEAWLEAVQSKQRM